MTQITISIGLAMYPLHGDNKQDLIAAADSAPYAAKNSGRNKTVLYRAGSGNDNNTTISYR